MFRTKKTNPKNLTNVKNQRSEKSRISLNTSETSVSLKTLSKQISLSSQSNSSDVSEDIFENKTISEIWEFLNECDQKNIHGSKKDVKKLNQQKNKFPSEELRAKLSLGNRTVRFTDLCYEDKKRIGHLISEFARVTEERNALANELKSDNEHASLLRGGFSEQKEHLKNFYRSAQFALKDQIEVEIEKQKLHKVERRKLLLVVKKYQEEIRKNKEKFHRKMIRLVEENINLQQRCDRYEHEVEECKDMLSIFGIREAFCCDRDFKCRVPHYPSCCCYNRRRTDDRHDFPVDNCAILDRNNSLFEIPCGRKRCPHVPKKKAIRCSCVDSKYSNVEKCNTSRNYSFRQTKTSFLKNLLEEEKCRLKATLLTASYDSAKPKCMQRVPSVQSEGHRLLSESCDIPNGDEGNESRPLSAPNSASTVISKKSKLFDNTDEHNLFEEVFFSNFKDVK